MVLDFEKMEAAAAEERARREEETRRAFEEYDASQAARSDEITALLEKAAVRNAEQQHAKMEAEAEDAAAEAREAVRKKYAEGYPAYWNETPKDAALRELAGKI